MGVPPDWTERISAQQRTRDDGDLAVEAQRVRHSLPAEACVCIGESVSAPLGWQAFLPSSQFQLQPAALPHIPMGRLPQANTDAEYEAREAFERQSLT